MTIDKDWVLVPREPTDEMLAAADSAIHRFEKEPGEHRVMGVDGASDAWNAMLSAAPPPVIDPTMADVAMGNAMEIGRLLLVQARLGNALAKLVDACYAADEREELAEEIDGSLLDEAEAAIALIDRFKPPRAAEAALRPGGGES